MEDFYRGTLAEEVVAAVRRPSAAWRGKAGLLTRDDLAGYRAVWRPAANSTYRGLHVGLPQPPPPIPSGQEGRDP